MAEAIGGYDFEFIEDLPEDLTCILCHYALKNPVQIEDCGHTFCKLCFHEMKDHASTNSTDFCCPLDRQVIDITRVFKNKADERKVLNLNVKCRYYVDGCDWIGELRNALEHEAKCCKNKTNKDKSFEIELQQLLNRMIELESKMKTNEENLVEKERQITDQNKEIQNQTKLIENQNKKIDNQNEEIKDLQTKVEVQNIQIENLIKFSNSQNKHIIDQNKEIINLQQYQSTMMIPDIEDDSDFTAINTAFQWKFNAQGVKEFECPIFSPPFYNIMNSHCFQLKVYFVCNRYMIRLHRYRGKYDSDSDEIRESNLYNFHIHVFGKNGKQKAMNFSNDDDGSIKNFFQIGRSEMRSENSLAECINNDEIDSLIIDSFVYLHCFFK